MFRDYNSFASYIKLRQCYISSGDMFQVRFQDSSGLRFQFIVYVGKKKGMAEITLGSAIRG